MIRRLTDLRSTVGVDEPVVFILAPSPERPVPAGDTRRGTAWIFRSHAGAAEFASWIHARHGIKTSPLPIDLRALCAALADRDLTWVVDPAPQPGLPADLSFKAPLSH